MPRLLTLLLFTALLASCVSAPEYPDEPVITFERLSKSQIFQDNTGPVDSLQIELSFTDGDGDLSQLSGDSVDIFLIDSRFPQVIQPFSIPNIPVEGTGNGISGDLSINIINTTGICCLFNNQYCVADERLPIDTFTYSIQIMDRAGNRSNTVQTTPIEVLCLER